MYAELNERYIHLFSVLFSSKNVLPKRQYDQMAEALMDSYKRELAILVGHYSLETGREMFELKEKLATFVPRKFLFFKNRVAKIIIKSCKEEFEMYLASLDTRCTEPTLESEECTAIVPVSTELVASGE